jgi:hypothetical protein
VTVLGLMGFLISFTLIILMRFGLQRASVLADTGRR